MGAVADLIILAGGLGTRLRAVVPDVPKCMAPVNGKPFLTYVIRYFQDRGIRNFIFSLGYKHEIITEFLKTYYAKRPKQSQISFEYSIEQEPLGTGGAIKKLAHLQPRGKSWLPMETLYLS